MRLKALRKLPALANKILDLSKICLKSVESAPKRAYMKKLKDPMSYLAHQEQINSDVMDKILHERQNADFSAINEAMVKSAINKANRREALNLGDFKALLSPAAAGFLEQMAQASKAAKERYFGKNIYLFTPLYIANHCDNLCVYCGFNSKNKIRRSHLSDEGLKSELENIAKSGLCELLVLTGESESKSPLDYIAPACKKASEYFATLGVEIYPLNTDGYERLHNSGVDFVTVFQETYSTQKYAKIHLEGNKRIFPYRINAQERALRGAMRGVAFGVLLGIDDWRADALSVGFHAHLLQAKYPHAQISLSVPRLRPFIHNARQSSGVNERELAQIICAYRLFLPYAGITLSTRESAAFRDGAMHLGISKLSAGVSVGIGSHSGAQSGDEQFEINDNRDVEAMRAAILKAGLTPVFNEHICL